MDSVIMLHFFYIKGAKKSEISKFHFFFFLHPILMCVFFLFWHNDHCYVLLMGHKKVAILFLKEVQITYMMNNIKLG